MDFFPKILFPFTILVLGTSTILAIMPGGSQYLFVSNISCFGDVDCSYCRNITLDTGSNGNTKPTYGSGSGSRYGSVYGYGYGYGSVSASNPTTPPAQVDLTGECTPFGKYLNFCLFCLTPNFFNNNTCNQGFCACGASVFDSEDCTAAPCQTEYKFDLSKLGTCN